MPTSSTGAAPRRPSAATTWRPRRPPPRAAWRTITTTAAWPPWWPPAARRRPDNPRRDAQRNSRMYAVSKAMPLDVTAEQTRQQILALVEGFTVETTPGSAATIPDYREHLRPGARVAVTFPPRPALPAPRATPHP